MDKRTLLVDLETYSSVDIGKAGVFKYTEATDFEILLLAYAWDDGSVRVIDLTKLDDADTAAELQDVTAGLLDPDTIKVAHNSAFERAALRHHLGRDMPPEEWEDTMVLAAYNGLPMSLDAAGAALQLKDQKIKEGTLLINYFCKPCRPTIANGGRTRNLPEHAPDKWARFIEYCRRDVEVEQAIYQRLKGYPTPPWERHLWALDARINERGVLVDRGLADAAIDLDATVAERLNDELRCLTGLDNPNSVAQLKDWLEERGVTCESLSKATLAQLIADAPDKTIRRVLELRAMASKTSVKKYQAAVTAAGSGDRLRGIMQYYGAGRTGRWAGRLFQPQNLPQNHMETLDLARALVKERDLDTLELLYGNVPDVLSQLIRTTLIAPPGDTLLVADFSAIEARVIAYLAGELWRKKAFEQGRDIYCASASKMFGVPVRKHGVNGHLRQKGKVAELACGYGGGVNALKAFGADKMGLTDAELQDIVTNWRAASPTIPAFWRSAERAAKQAIDHPGMTYYCGDSNCIRYYKDADALRCLLPSCRVLSYWGAALDTDGSICFMGQNQTTRKWEKTSTWGGKLVENIVQAVARDCLAVSLLRLDRAGYEIVFHVHDEVVVQAPLGSRWEDMAKIMGTPIDWAPGLVLRADGYDTPYYKKD